MTPKKIISIVVAVAAAAACVAGSVRIERLSDRNARLAAQVFSPTEMVDRFWDRELDSMLAGSLDLATFDSLLRADPRVLADTYGKNIGIGFPKSIFLHGTATVTAADKDHIALATPGKTGYAIACGRIFSNTVREASGVFDIDAFENTMDFNLVSSQINGRIDSLVIRPVRAGIARGTVVRFAGAADVYPDRPVPEALRIVPLRLEIVSETAPSPTNP